MTLNKLNKPNILILMNDQQRVLQGGWPKSWEEKYLPNMMRLKKNGMSFTQATTTACACSSSRAALLTGTYPTLNGVVNTLSPVDATISGAENPGNMPFNMNKMRPTDVNLARIMSAAGYHSVWKGKWHLSQPIDGGDNWTQKDIKYMKEAYGFDEWNPNDAANSESNVLSLGAGAGGNDERYVTGQSLPTDDSPQGESILEFINKQKACDSPFFMVVSLCNPHDIWVAPMFEDSAGYDANDIDQITKDYGLPLPETWDEDLTLKPAIQQAFKESEAGVDFITKMAGNYTGGMLHEEGSKQRYVNFYAYLQTLADQEFGKILDALDDKGLTDDTLIILMSDHGEMGLAHGLREKEFVAYDEAIRVPLVFSNPQVYKGPKESHAPVSLIDIAPTLASIVNKSDEYSAFLQGVDFTSILNGEEKSVQEYVHFMTDDSAAPNSNNDPGFIRTIRSPEWMYSVYYIVLNSDQAQSISDDYSGWCKTSGDGSSVYYQYELYDLKADPNQANNLAGMSDYENQQLDLHQKLIDMMNDNKTVPDGMLLPTPALVELIKDDVLNNPLKALMEPSVINPIWPLPKESISQSMAYRAYVMNKKTENG